MTLQELAVDHPYYASDSNYYSNDAGAKWTTFSDFYEEYIKADIDMNLIYRWDIKQREESKRYYCQIFIIHQRKGIYAPHYIDYIDEIDVPNFLKLVQPHIDCLLKIWNPIIPSTLAQLES